MKKKICWEKFQDPLGINEDNLELPGYLDDEEVEAIDELKEEGAFSKKMLSVMNTPFGVMTVGDHSLVSKRFDLWWMYSNFNMTKEIVEIIEGVSGVEFIDPYSVTRYRIKIGFPISGLFDTAKVKNDIRLAIEKLDSEVDEDFDALLEEIFSEEVVQEVAKIRESVRDSKQWAIYILPNGNVNYIKSDDSSEEYMDDLLMYRMGQEMVGGILLTSDDYQ